MNTSFTNGPLRPSPRHDLEEPNRPAGLLSPDSDGQEHTSQRLLDAAERLFAERGYAGASVRDITAMAGSNIASVNYHFGGKEALYIAVFERMITQLRDERIAAVQAVVDEAEQQQDVSLVLRAFAEAFMRPLTEPRRAVNMLSLYLAELASPQLPAGMFMQEMVEPTQRVLGNAMRRASKGLSDRDALFCLHAFVGQLIHMVQFWRMTLKSEGRARFEISEAVDHAVRFSTAGIQACLAHSGGSSDER